MSSFPLDQGFFDFISFSIIAAAIGSVVIILLVVVAILWALRRTMPPREDPAIAELKARYARGEIETAEFQVRLRELSGE